MNKVEYRKAVEGFTLTHSSTNRAALAARAEALPNAEQEEAIWDTYFTACEKATWAYFDAVVALDRTGFDDYTDWAREFLPYYPG